MEWMFDPSAWLGLLTLIVLEIVLGIDNLIFVAILVDKLPRGQQGRARTLGLGLALGLRLALLSSIFWMASLTAPLFAIAGHAFAGRDLVYLAGGLFLIYKATGELHERIQGAPQKSHRAAARFWPMIAQIMVIDLVFSIDSIITAVGMVDHLTPMFIAVIVAVVLMMVASGPLAAFIHKRPTVVVLCLGFLLMIGFSLIADGMGVEVPKTYLYVAIGFSVFVEVMNQLAGPRKTKRRK